MSNISKINTIIQNMKPICTLSNSKTISFEESEQIMINMTEKDLFFSDNLNDIYKMSMEFVDIACGTRTDQIVCSVLAENLPANGFVCITDVCNKKYGRSKRGILIYMGHILQDIFLFRNILKLPQYKTFFQHIIGKERDLLHLKALGTTIGNLSTTASRASNAVDGNSDPLFIDKTKSTKLSNSRTYSVEVKNKKREQEEYEDSLYIHNSEIDHIFSELMRLTPLEFKELIVIPTDDKKARQAVDIILSIIYLRQLDNTCRRANPSEETTEERQIRQLHEKIIEVLEERLEETKITRPHLFRGRRKPDLFEI